VAVGVFILALSARLLFQAAGVGWDSPPRDDAAQYDAIAWSLAQGGPYVATDGYVSHRAPAYPFLLAGVYTIFGHSWTAARVTQALLGAATAVALLFLGSGMLPTHLRVLTSCVYAVFPFSIYWSGYLLSEPLCILLVVLSMCALFKCRSAPGWSGVWGFACGMTALARPNMGILVLLGLPWVNARGARRIGWCAVAAAAFLLTLLPWTLRNYSVHHRLVAVTTMGGIVLWESNNPYLLSDKEMMGRSSHAPDLPEARLVRGLSEVEEDAIYLRLALDFIGTHWREMPRLLAYKMARLWNPLPVLPSRAQSVGAALCIIPMFLMFGVGLWLAWTRGEPWLAPMLLPVAAVTMTALIYWADARIRSPADPFIMFVAVYGLSSAWSGFVRRHGARPGV